MQGGFTKFLQLWIPNKTDKGSVVTDVFEPNFTKLDQNAETTNKTLTDLGNNKLDKGTYSGKASDLKAEIDGKVSKSGDELKGNLNITGGSYPIEINTTSFNGAYARGTFFTKNGNILGGYGGAGNDTGLTNLYMGIGTEPNTNPELIITKNDVKIRSNRLETITKDYAEALNEVNALAKTKLNYTMLATLLGTTYEGYIQTPGTKIKGKIYSSTTSDQLFLCIKDTDIEYVDYTYFTGSSVLPIMRIIFSEAKTVLTPTQGFSVTYRQIRENLVSIIFNNTLSSNAAGSEYYFPFPVSSIAMANATPQNSNEYVRVLGGSSENSFKLFSANSLNNVKVELLVYAKNKLIDW